MKVCPYCAEEIQDAAIKCRYCGSQLGTAAVAPPPEASRTSPAVSVLVLVCLVGALMYFSGMFSVADPTGRAVLPQPVGSASPVVTKAEFDQLREGMSYDDAARIIGVPGELQSSSDIAGIKTVMYSWMNSNGSNMNAMFQGDRLVTKAQFGLP